MGPTPKVDLTRDPNDMSAEAMPIVPDKVFMDALRARAQKAEENYKFTSFLLETAQQAIEELKARVAELEKLLKDIRPLLIDVDSELSAQGHGRPQSPDKELLEMSGRARDLHKAAVRAIAPEGDARKEGES